MESFKGRPFLLSQLARPAKTGRVSHAQIFAGPEGTGRHTAARHIAQCINCTGSGKRPCGVCPSCLRFQNDETADYITVNPDGSFIKVEQIRQVLADLSIHPESGYKCIVLYPADRMNESAQNALLKTLEEAPEYAVFFLITDRPAALLSTIRSRCVTVRFSPISEEEVAQVLENQHCITPANAVKAAKRSGGSVGKALSLLKNEDYETAMAFLMEIISKVKTADDVSKVSGLIPPLKDKSRIIAQILEESASELMRRDISNMEMTALSKTLLEHGVDGADLMAAVLEFSGMLDSFVSFQSAFEMLLYEITSGDN